MVLLMGFWNYGFLSEFLVLGTKSTLSASLNELQHDPTSMEVF